MILILIIVLFLILYYLYLSIKKEYFALKKICKINKYSETNKYTIKNPYGNWKRIDNDNNNDDNVEKWEKDIDGNYYNMDTLQKNINIANSQCEDYKQHVIDTDMGNNNYYLIGLENDVLQQEGKISDILKMNFWKKNNSNKYPTYYEKKKKKLKKKKKK